MTHRVLVHGSLALDYIMSFDGNLYDNSFIDSEKKSFHMAVMPRTKKMQYGGTAGNISYNLGLLGEPCEVMTSVGHDFDTTEYRRRFEAFPNIKLNLIEYSDGFCANAYIVNDIKKQQLIVYHGGVTQRLPQKTLKERGVDKKSISWGINSPENPIQMVRFTEELSEMGIDCIMDTGQVTPAFHKKQLMKMIKNSSIMICNEHEFKMILEKTELEPTAILEYIPTVIVTKGEDGSEILTENNTVHIPIVTPNEVKDPTGAGDGFRAGLLMALNRELSIELGCRMGATVGSFVVETVGAQTHSFTLKKFIDRFERTFKERLDLSLD